MEMGLELLERRKEKTEERTKVGKRRRRRTRTSRRRVIKGKKVQFLDDGKVEKKRNMCAVTFIYLEDEAKREKRKKSWVEE